MDNKVVIIRGRLSAEGQTELFGNGLSLWIRIDRGDSGSRDTTRQPGDEQANNTKTNHGNAVTDCWRSIPEAVYSGFHVGGKYCSLGGQVFGQRRQRRRRHPVAILMRIKAEHRLAH